MHYIKCLYKLSLKNLSAKYFRKLSNSGSKYNKCFNLSTFPHFFTVTKTRPFEQTRMSVFLVP
jgi:hypothetical protein